MVARLFERFGQESPITVMVRATLENAFSAPALDRLFMCTAEQQYTRTLLFSTVVELMTTVVLQQEKSLHAAFQQRREQGAVGSSSLYEELARRERGVAEAAVRYRVERVEGSLFRLSVRYKMLPQVRQQFRRIDDVVPHARAEGTKGVDESAVMSCEESVILLFHCFPPTRLCVSNRQLSFQTNKNYADTVSGEQFEICLLIPNSAKI
jgi:hypothetical protein